MIRQLFQSLFASSSRQLRAKVALGVVLPVAVGLTLFMTIEHRNHTRASMAGLSLLVAHSSVIIENSLRNRIHKHDLAEIQELFDALSKTALFHEISLTDPAGRVLFSTARDTVGTLIDRQSWDCRSCHEPSPNRQPTRIIAAADGTPVFRSLLPMRGKTPCEACHQANPPLTAVLITEIPSDPLQSAVAGRLKENLTLWVATVFLALLFVSLSLNRFVLGRIRRIAQTIARFGEGEINPRLDVDGTDEIGELAKTFNGMADRIETKDERNRLLSAELRQHSDLQEHLLRRVIDVQEDERRRIARDLHDDLGQDLAGLALTLEAVQRLWTDPPDPVRLQLGRIRNRLSEMTDRTYDWIFSLRPSELDDMGLVPALRTHADRVMATSTLKIEIDDSRLDRRLPTDIETALFRTFQEALSNVVRHSGAGKTHIVLIGGERVCEARIIDDGSGFDPASIAASSTRSKGLGILGMQERVSLCGGSLEIDSRPGAGTRIHIKIPLQE